MGEDVKSSGFVVGWWYPEVISLSLTAVMVCCLSVSMAVVSAFRLDLHSLPVFLRNNLLFVEKIVLALIIKVALSREYCNSSKMSISVLTIIVIS